MNSGFRTQNTQDAYNTVIAAGHLENKCPLCEEKVVVKTFTYWKIMKNAFPYDAVAQKHDMIVPMRHVIESELTEEEKEELQILKKGYLNDNYDFILESLPKYKSIPPHFHLHLIIPK